MRDKFNRIGQLANIIKIMREEEVMAKKFDIHKIDPKVKAYFEAQGNIGHIVSAGIIPGSNTRYAICDDYCRDATPADVQRILDNIGAIGRRILIHAQEGK